MDNDDKFKKPEHVKARTWDQHLDWMKVMSEQVATNIQKDTARQQKNSSSNAKQDKPPSS
ncbi:MAG: hypothetical protein KJO62_10700 [Gammaproteobacteria bacterium]|nr:hypothetical protein [Gammaproteobacteria bacterium]